MSSVTHSTYKGSSPLVVISKGIQPELNNLASGKGETSRIHRGKSARVKVTDWIVK